MKQRAPLILIAVAALFLVIAYVLSRGSASIAPLDAGPAKVQKERKPVVFPRDKRFRKQSAPLADSKVTPEQRKQALDQMQRALLPKDGSGAVFVEINAIRHTPLMEKILKCREAEMLEGMNAFKNELGVDPMEDLDRVGVMKGVVAASGYFEGFKVPAELGEGTKYGGGADIWKAKDDDGSDLFFAKVGGDLMLTANNEADLKAAIDRAEGRAEAGPPLDAELSKAEMYGTLDGALAKEILASSGSPEAQRLADTISKADMRMDVDENVAASFDIGGKTPEDGENLRKALTAAIALARVQAENNGEEDLAWLLSQANVEGRADGQFELDVAVPGDLLLESMGCDAEGKPKRAVPVAPPAPTPPSP